MFVCLVICYNSLNNIYTIFQIPFCDTRKKKIGIIRSRLVTLKCQLPRIGFTVGQFIPVMCTIENNSNKILTLKAKLRQQIFLMALSERKVCNRKVLKMIGPNIKSNSKFEQILNITLPEKLPIVYGTCQLVHINYILDIYLDIPWSINLLCRLPIILTYQQLDIESIKQFKPSSLSLTTHNKLSSFGCFGE